jgi:hypothetical protein
MSKLRCHITISLDGFVAGPNQSDKNPLGEGGERLHPWMGPLAAWRQSHGEQSGEVNESTRIFEEPALMGRNMFGPVRGGAWGDEQWTGWWGDNRHRRNRVRAQTGKGGRRGQRRHAPQVQGGDIALKPRQTPQPRRSERFVVDRRSD